MVRFGHRRRLSLQACLQVEALRAETRYLPANAVEIWAATATVLVAMMNRPITATVMLAWVMARSGGMAGRSVRNRDRKESAIVGSGQQ